MLSFQLDFKYNKAQTILLRYLETPVPNDQLLKMAKTALLVSKRYFLKLDGWWIWTRS
jgi:hypothetical protein